MSNEEPAETLLKLLFQRSKCPDEADKPPLIGNEELIDKDSPIPDEYVKEIEGSMLKTIINAKNSFKLDNSEETFAKIHSLLIVVFKLLDYAQSPELISELLQTICSFGKLHHHFIDNIVTPQIIERISNLLNSSDSLILEQAITTIGVILEEAPRTHSLFLNMNIRKKIFYLLSENKCRNNFRKICYWVLTLLVNVNHIEDEDSQYYIELIITTLNNESDKEILVLTCKLISILCQNKDYLMIFFQNQIIQKVVFYLSEYDSILIRPCLRVIGNIICLEVDRENSIDYTQEILRYNIVPVLKHLMENKHKDIEKEACWTISNIAAGTVDQIQVLLDNDIIGVTISLMKKYQLEIDILTEIAYILFNITTGGSEVQIASIVNESLINMLISLLYHPQLVEGIIDSVDNILQIGDHLGRINNSENKYIELISHDNLELLRECKYVKGKRKGEKLWSYYCIECKICQHVYSRLNSPLTFCNECRCYVCSSCDCSKYHIDNVLNKIQSLSVTSPISKSKKKKNKKKKKTKVQESQNTNTQAFQSTPSSSCETPTTDFQDNSTNIVNQDINTECLSNDTVNHFSNHINKSAYHNSILHYSNDSLLSHMLHISNNMDTDILSFLNTLDITSEESSLLDISTLNTLASTTSYEQTPSKLFQSLVQYNSELNKSLNSKESSICSDDNPLQLIDNSFHNNNDILVQSDKLMDTCDYDDNNDTLSNLSSLSMDDMLLLNNNFHDYSENNEIINSQFIEELLYYIESNSMKMNSNNSSSEVCDESQIDTSSVISHYKSFLDNKLKSLYCTKQDFQLCDSLIDYLESTKSIVGLADKIEQLNNSKT